MAALAMTSLLDHTIYETHNPASGRYDAQRVGEILHLPTAKVARMIGRNEGAVRKTPDAPAYQASLGRVVRLMRRVSEALGSLEATRIWLNAGSDDLGGSTPMQYLLAGRIEAVEAIVEAAISGEGI